MTANELRIGNLITINKVIVTVGYGIIMDMYRKEKNRKIKKEYLDSLTFEPIPLTEEWLIRFGFIKNECGFYEKGRFAYSDNHGWSILNQMIKGWVGVKELKYVHQLQNLYFALTGEELTIKQ